MTAAPEALAQLTALPEPPGQSPVLLAVTCCRHSSVGTELCWETAQRVWQHSPAALPLLYATALHQPPAPQESQLTLSPLGPCTAPHTCINFVLRLQAATPRAGAEARTDVRMLSRGDPGPLLSFHWINATPNIQKKKRKSRQAVKLNPRLCSTTAGSTKLSQSQGSKKRGRKHHKSWLYLLTSLVKTYLFIFDWPHLNFAGGWP